MIKEAEKKQLIRMVSEGYPYKEIAERMGIGIDAVNIRVRKLKNSGELPNVDRRRRIAEKPKPKKQPRKRAETVHAYKKIGIDGYICPVCQKLFYGGPLWVYKAQQTKKPVCSYTCMRQTQQINANS